MDEAFLPLGELVTRLLPTLPDLYDPAAGVRSRITGYDVSTPIELTVEVDPSGSVSLGSVPPLYHLATSTMPVLHQIRIRAVRVEVE